MSIGEKFDALISKGREAYEEREYDKAIKVFEEALDLAEEHFPDYIQEISNQINYAKQAKYFEEKSNEAAANEAEQWASAFGAKVEDFEGIIADKNDLLRDNPAGKDAIAMAYYICGLALMSKGKHDKAIEYFSNAIDYEPDSIRFYQERPPEVFQERYKAMFNGLPPSNYAGTLALQKRALEYNYIKDFDKAIADFERLIKFDLSAYVSLSNTYMNRGIANYKKKEHGRAIDDFEEALDKNRDNNTARQLLEMVKAEKANQ